MNRFLLAAAGAICLATVACNGQKPTTAPVGEKSGGAVADARDIGQPLSEAPFRPAKAGDRPPEPITLPLAQALVLDKLELSAKVDGTIWWIGAETTPADAAAAGIEKVDLYTHPRTKKVYRRLKPGDDVTPGQVLVLMDDSRAQADYESARIALKVAQQQVRAARETVVKVREIEAKTRDGATRQVVPPVELLQAEARTIQYEGEAVKAEGDVQKATGDEAKAQLIADMHTLTSNIVGKVTQVLKLPGEGVKAQEPILTIQRLDRMRAVGNLPQELNFLVNKGDEVLIEAPINIPAALGKSFDQHTTNKSITAVTVGMANGKPVIVSAGEDGEVLVWDRDLNFLASWSQPAGVRALAVTRPGVEPALAVVGSDNGIASLYNLADPKADRVREFEGRHEGGVTAAAFSPDGKYCVTADEKVLHLYEVATGKRKYSFGGGDHFSSITHVSFTPQGRVVSVGREPSVRVWIVGDKAAKVDRRFSARVGDVAALGVTDEGSHMLLDAAKTQLDVIHLQEGRKERPLIGAGEAGRFATFAVWSPSIAKAEDRRLIATTGGAEGVVQLWLAPTEQDRGIEVARLNTRDLSAATCAAFAPVSENGFLVVGTRRGVLHVWSRPDLPAKPKATVTNVGSTIDSSGKTVEMLVEFTNPKVSESAFLFRPGSSVTLVVRPKK
ncbi:MAG TPA: hypothetical protein VM597_30615 [Gemmataceae bacterium]|nr:hypothetical protein [Gemmataceae bacterium]